MGSDKSKRVKPNSWLIVLIIFSCAALSPEYIAPVLTVVGAIYTMRKKGFEKRSLSSFSIGYSYFLFFGWMIIGAFYANSIISALASILLWSVMFSGLWICTVWLDTEEKIQRIIFGGCIASGVAGSIGIIQAIARTIFGNKPATIINPFWRFLDILIEKFVSILPEFISSNFARTTFKLFANRSCGTFSNPLFFATFLVAMISFTIYCFLNGKKKSHRIIGFASLLLTLGGIATSLSRGPYIVTAIVFVILLIYGGKRALKVLGVGVAGGAAIVLVFGNVIKRLLTLISGTDKSVNTRTRILAAVSEKIPEKFLFGYGTGFDSVRSILHDEYDIPQPHAHNIILEFQMENGIIGVILFLLVCVVFAYNIFRLYKKGGMARDFGITFFTSFMAMCMCGMTDCIFYGLKPLQYFMLIMGLTQASANIFLKEDKPFSNLKTLKKSKKTNSDKIKNKEHIRV